MWTLLVRYKQRPAPQNDTRGVPSGGTSPPDPRLARPAARARRGASSAATERRAAAIGGPLQRAAARPAAALSVSVDLPRVRDVPGHRQRARGGRNARGKSRNGWCDACERHGDAHAENAE